MALPVQPVAIHITHVQGVDFIDTGVGQRRAPGLDGQRAQRNIPVLAHRRLPHAQNGYITHGYSRRRKYRFHSPQRMTDNLKSPTSRCGYLPISLSSRAARNYQAQLTTFQNISSNHITEPIDLRSNLAR